MSAAMDAEIKRKQGGAYYYTADQIRENIKRHEKILAEARKALQRAELMEAVQAAASK